uniref:Protein kinase domain-containing protein n=1 Tax=Setaria digitata TaxID=48799 RepID=A0A915Q5B0_9BILA
MGGSLENHLQQFTYEISTGERILYSFEAAKGMCYLQEKELIHRDLATRNCLISKYGTIKISDFGLSQLVGDLSCTTTKQRVPVRWMAPETIQREPHYSVKSDVWSYGVLLYEIFNNGIKPWPEMDVRRCATNIRHGIMPDMPENTPSEIIDLANKCWKMNIEKRCDFKYIVKKLKKIQLLYAPPKITDLTIAKLKNVQILTEKEVEIEEEKNENEMESLSKTSNEGICGEKSTADLTISTKYPSALLCNEDATRHAPLHIEIRKKELERRRQMEKEAAILNEIILECVADEIKKLLSSRKKNRRKHKHKKRHDKRHRRSRRPPESLQFKTSEHSGTKMISSDSETFSRESNNLSREKETLSRESDNVSREKTLSRESDNVSRESDNFSREKDENLSRENASFSRDKDSFPKEKLSDEKYQNKIGKKMMIKEKRAMKGENRMEIQKGKIQSKYPTSECDERKCTKAHPYKEMKKNING